MKNCKNCALRSVYTCDIYGAIPVDMITVDMRCASFEQLDDAEKVLKSWLAGIDRGSIEANYVQSILDAMQLKSFVGLDGAVSWLYTLPDTRPVRAVREAVQIFDTEIFDTEIPF